MLVDFVKIDEFFLKYETVSLFNLVLDSNDVKLKGYFEKVVP